VRFRLWLFRNRVREIALYDLKPLPEKIRRHFFVGKRGDAFDQWFKIQKADAWDKGHLAGGIDAWDHQETPNPYREGHDRGEED
jgi:hypothetical protein